MEIETKTRTEKRKNVSSGGKPKKRGIETQIKARILVVGVPRKKKGKRSEISSQLLYTNISGAGPRPPLAKYSPGGFHCALDERIGQHKAFRLQEEMSGDWVGLI